MRKYGKRPNHQTVTERNVGLAAGAFFIVLAILSGMGSISLGNPVPTQGGGVSGAYLVTNYAFVLLALAFGGLGAFFAYRGGQASPRPDRTKKNQKERESQVISK